MDFQKSRSDKKSFSSIRSYTAQRCLLSFAIGKNRSLSYYENSGTTVIYWCPRLQLFHQWVLFCKENGQISEILHWWCAVVFLPEGTKIFHSFLVILCRVVKTRQVSFFVQTDSSTVYRSAIFCKGLKNERLLRRPFRASPHSSALQSENPFCKAEEGGDAVASSIDDNTADGNPGESLCEMWMRRYTRLS